MKFKINKILLLILIVILVAAPTLFYLYIKGYFREDPYGKNQVTQQRNSTEAGVRDNNEIENNNANNEAKTDSSRPIINRPTQGQTIEQSSPLEGIAPGTENKVYYRLQSDEAGLLGQGELAVKNESFSGTIDTGGYKGPGFIEVYLFDNQGRERDNTRVEVIFQ